MIPFWQNKKVLVTGGHGFVGSYVVEQLEKIGVKTEDIRIPRSKDFDLRCWENCLKAVKGIDVVIHMAARVGGIGYNGTCPGTLFYDNAVMGIQLMEAARQTGVNKFIALCTVCAYPKFTEVPFREVDLWKGYPEETNAPYGLAKRMLVVQSKSYREQYGFNSVVVIPTNMYGPRDNFDLNSSHVIPALIRKFTEAVRENKNKVEVWGTGDPSREFLYVEDGAEAILLAAEKYNKSEPVNIGTGSQIIIRDLVKTIAELIGFEGNIIWDTAKPDGQPKRCLDTTRAEKEFGFKAKTSLREGLTKTINWYLNK